MDAEVKRKIDREEMILNVNSNGISNKVSIEYICNKNSSRVIV